MKITSIFISVDGEVNKWGQGIWTTFIRFYGCKAHCNYCDTKYSWDGEYTNMTVPQVLDKVPNYSIDKVTITGGEPFEQRLELNNLVYKLLLYDLKVSIETNGLHDPRLTRDDILCYHDIQPRHLENLCIVMDYKLSSAGEHVTKRVKPEHFLYLTKNDYIKFVIQTREDYEEAKFTIINKINTTKARIAFSPCKPLHPMELFNWIKDDGLYWIDFNLQIHKYIFPIDDWRKEEK